MVLIILPRLVFIFVGILLFILSARFLPHNQNLEQQQQWKISILFSIGFFVISFIFFCAGGILKFSSDDQNIQLLSIEDYIRSFSDLVLEVSCFGIYPAILLLFLGYRKFSYAPWLKVDLQTGADSFDSVIAYARKFFDHFRRPG